MHQQGVGSLPGAIRHPAINFPLHTALITDSSVDDVELESTVSVDRRTRGRGL